MYSKKRSFLIHKTDTALNFYRPNPKDGFYSHRQNRLLTIDTNSEISENPSPFKPKIFNKGF